MDKYEYNLRNEEINALIGRREYQKAVAIADTIDWTKVRSVKTLCKISDLYKVNRRYNESKILLEQALDRCPTGKTIVSSLCELCIRMDDVVGAMEYYKQFVQMAPTDNIKFILLYKIYEMQEASLDERIEVLEELKKRERIEKWCYELAYLYHRIGLTTRCVEECDDLILWFREGKFVKKAMELKMLHQQLTQSQEVLYQNMLDPLERMTYMEQPVVTPEEQPVIGDDVSFVAEPVAVPEHDDVLVKTVDVGQYSTMNIQKALEESIRGTLDEEYNPTNTIEQVEDSTVLFSNEDVALANEQASKVEADDKVAEAILAPMLQDTGEMQELFFEAENTGELELDPEVMDQAVEVTEEVAEVAEEPAPAEPVLSNTAVFDATLVAEVESALAEDNRLGDTPLIIRPVEEEVTEQTAEIPEVVFPDVPVTEDTIIYNKGDIAAAAYEEAAKVVEEKVYQPDVAPVPGVDYLTASKEELMELIDKKVAEALANAMSGLSMTAGREHRREDMSHVAPPRSMQKMLSQEYDGQISLVVPEEEKVEKQITGQINLEEYLSSWEEQKKQSLKKQEEKIKNRLMEETGSLFSDFDLRARDTILEKIDKNAEADKKAPIDPDKEYEEYLKKIMAESEAEAAEEVEEVVPEEESAVETEVAPEEEPAADAEVAPEEEPTDSQTEELPEVEELEEIEEISDEEDEVEEPEEVTEEPDEVEEPEEVAEEPEEEVEEPGQFTRELPPIEDLDDSEDKESDSEEEPIEEEKSDDEKEMEELEEELQTEEIDENVPVRELTDEEMSLFSQFVQTKKAKISLTKALDSISLASYTGNVFVTGDSGEEPLELAKSVVQYAKSSDGNFSGKIGKITGIALNDMDVTATVERLKNGGLIIEKPSGMKADTAKALVKVLNQDNLGVLVVMQDSRKEMNRLFSKYEGMKQIFNVHIEIEELSDDALVAYGRKYAERMEYAIDEMGILALHTRIDEMQTSDHIVTVSDVRDIVDEAIEHATKFSPKHITDVLLGKRYDDDDMIILKERDFNI